MISELRKVLNFYRWLKVTVDVRKAEESDFLRYNADYDTIVTIGDKGDWYWTYFYFKGDTLVNWYISE